MAEESYPAVLQAMIDRAAALSEAETKQLGDVWEEDEGWVLPEPNVLLELTGQLNPPFVTNEALVTAWERVLDAAGKAGRLNEIDAARAAGRAAVNEVRHEHDTEAEKNGTEEAVRAAVLAVGMIDLISKDDYYLLVSPWQNVLGTTLVEHDL